MINTSEELKLLSESELTPVLKKILDRFLKSSAYKNSEYTSEQRLKVKKQLSNYSFREKVYEHYNNTCEICGIKGKLYILNNRLRLGVLKILDENNLQIVERFEIHHKDYDWDCPYIADKSFNCVDVCLIEHPEKFQKCLDSVILLCSKCHYKVHVRLLADTGKWTPQR